MRWWSSRRAGDGGSRSRRHRMPVPFVCAVPEMDLAVRPPLVPPRRPPGVRCAAGGPFRVQAGGRTRRGDSFGRSRPMKDMTHDAPATILLAEDDATTRTFLADELTADGYELLTCETAAEAVRLLGTKFPDLVI